MHCSLHLTFNIFNNDSPACSRGNRWAKVLVHYLVFLFVFFFFCVPRQNSVPGFTILGFEYSHPKSLIFLVNTL